MDFIVQFLNGCFPKWHFLVVYLCFYWIVLDNSERILGKVFLSLKTLRFFFLQVFEYTSLSATSCCHLANSPESSRSQLDKTISSLNPNTTSNSEQYPSSCIETSYFYWRIALIYLQWGASMILSLAERSSNTFTVL